MDDLLSLSGDGTIELLVLLTLIALLPSLIIMVTSFTRTVIVMSFLRNAMGLQNTPPNMVLIGISIFLTLFIMNPVIEEIDQTAYQPYQEGTITQAEALDAAQDPLKEWMLKQTEISSLNLFLDLSGTEYPGEDDLTSLPLAVVIPSFITSELSRAFVMGFLLYLPFVLIDIVVASTLMSMGMIMLPPAMISMPFKLLLFVVLNGWELVFGTIVRSFY